MIAILRAMLVWRVFQLLVTFAGGSAVIYFGQNTPGPPINPLIVFGFGVLCAYLATTVLVWLLDYWRRRSAREP